MSQPVLSLLLGSGFSRPAEYPSTDYLNTRLANISRWEVSFSFDSRASWCDPPESPDVASNRRACNRFDDQIFLEQFLNFYRQIVLGPGCHFDYEEFYDYYQSLRYGVTRDARFEVFVEQNKSRFPQTAAHNLLFRFNSDFQQLVASLLAKKPTCSHLARNSDGSYGDHPYSAFLCCMDVWIKEYLVKVHTLNHDLLFEDVLARTDTMNRSNFTDGFSDTGSPYYINASDPLCDYKIRLRMYANDYSGRVCLYKLHGSIDQYWYNLADDAHHVVKVPRHLTPPDSTIYKEMCNQDGIHYAECPLDADPDFLSGRQIKEARYHDPHYRDVINHFKTNLSHSSFVVVIGYGFRDKGINQRIEEFAADPLKRIAIIDVNKPSHPICNQSNVKYVGGGVESFDPTDVISFMDCSLTPEQLV